LPTISNDIITVHLQNYNIQLLSPITHINAGFNIKELNIIINKLDKTLEPIKNSFEEITNKKLNYEQIKYILENSLSEPNPAPVLELFNIT